MAEGSDPPKNAVTAPRRKQSPIKWTAEQDAQLRAAVVRFNFKQWKKVAEFVTDRNHIQCLQRWQKVLKPGLKKGQWSAEEDALLRTHAFLAKQEGTWRGVAAQIEGRSAKQCRERWMNHLDASINKGPYSAEEDERVQDLFRKLGSKWADISRMMKGRTENSVKLRCKALGLCTPESSPKMSAQKKRKLEEVCSPFPKEPLPSMAFSLPAHQPTGSRLKSTGIGMGLGIPPMTPEMLNLMLLQQQQMFLQNYRQALLATQRMDREQVSTTNKLRRVASS